MISDDLRNLAAMMKGRVNSSQLLHSSEVHGIAVQLDSIASRVAAMEDRPIPADRRWPVVVRGGAS